MLKKDAIVTDKELENSVISGSCHRQFGSNSHYRFFRFVDDRTRKARCMTDDMFSTSANLFLYLRENRLQKINNQKTVTLSSGGYNALHCHLSVAVIPPCPITHCLWRDSAITQVNFNKNTRKDLTK